MTSAERGEKRETDLLEAAWQLVAERGWRGFSPSELARRTTTPLPTIYALFPDRRSLVTALGRRLDAAMLDVPLAELDGMSPRERLFELSMRRFEAMRPFREGLRAAGREVALDPCLAIASLANLERAADWLLDTSGIRLHGLAACLARRALQLAYLRAFRVFLRDDSADLARTMAELDRRLGELEAWARFFGGGRGETGAAAAPAA
ncbi:MAG: hypothetical protein KatS3mg117_0122 [Geminicoccaceae bacterium]|nr:MAG: hypothetical protein KatS3mg117_0122 [Geminicoccaceae bacterium]